MQTTKKYSQKDLDFWLASFVQRGRDHTPEWVTVSKLLRLGANPTNTKTHRPGNPAGYCLPSAIETCQEMVEIYDPETGRMADPEHWTNPEAGKELCRKTQAHFERYLNQFRKAGFLA